jgi:uncharacterized membrane protein
MARHPRWVLALMSEAELDAVAHAIARAEASTSAEIRVHLDHRCPGEPMPRAIEVFERLGMHRTDGRNGVLIYAAIADRQLAVIGDTEIHARVGEAYWRELVQAVTRHLREGRPGEAFIHAVAEVGAVLSRHFPPRGDDRDELENRVSVE